MRISWSLFTGMSVFLTGTGVMYERLWLPARLVRSLHLVLRAEYYPLISDLAGRRMIELYQRFGDTLYFSAIDELLVRNRKAVGAIISKMPEEPAYFEDWIDDDGQGVGPWKVACTMTRKGERLHFDFSGTDPQSPSSINFYLSIAM